MSRYGDGSCEANKPSRIFVEVVPQAPEPPGDDRSGPEIQLLVVSMPGDKTQDTLGSDQGHSGKKVAGPPSVQGETALTTDCIDWDSQMDDGLFMIEKMAQVMKRCSGYLKAHHEGLDRILYTHMQDNLGVEKLIALDPAGDNGSALDVQVDEFLDCVRNTIYQDACDLNTPEGDDVAVIITADYRLKELKSDAVYTPAQTMVYQQYIVLLKQIYKYGVESCTTGQVKRYLASFEKAYPHFLAWHCDYVDLEGPRAARIFRGVPKKALAVKTVSAPLSAPKPLPERVVGNASASMVPGTVVHVTFVSKTDGVQAAWKDEVSGEYESQETVKPWKRGRESRSPSRPTGRTSKAGLEA